MVLDESEFVARLKAGESLASIASWFEEQVKQQNYRNMGGELDVRDPTPFETWFWSDVGCLLDEYDPDAETA